MTLISVIYGNQYPVIVTDRAISDPAILNKIKLPSTGMESESAVNVVDFRIKSIIIRDILCLAFAGMEYKIILLYEDICDFFLHREINRENLELYLNELEPDPELVVIFALGGPEFEHNMIMVAAYGVFEQDHSRKQLNIIAGGTGAQEWISHLVYFQSYLKSSGDRLTDCLHRAFLGTMRFMASEMHSVENLQDGWGGGFDVIYYADGRFHRKDDITYSFLFTKQEDLSEIKVVNINHNKYIEHGVVVFNINNLKSGDMDATLVPYISEKLLPSILDTKLAFISHEIVTCVFIKLNSDTLDKMVMVLKEWDHHPDPLALAALGEDRLRFVFKPSYKKAVFEAVRSYLK